MNLYKKIGATLGIIAFLILNACDDKADQFGGNNLKSGYVALQIEDQLIIAEGTTLSVPVELNTAINPNGVEISYSVEAVNGTLPSGFSDSSNGMLNINAGEISSTIELTIPQSGTEYSFRVMLTGVDDTDFTIGLSDNSKVTESDIFVLSNEDIILAIDENPNQGQVLTTINSIFGDGATYSIQEGNIAGAFNINETTGELSVGDRLLFDWEINPQLTTTILITSETFSVEKEVEVNLNDITNLWTGSALTYVYEGGGDPLLEENQDRITDNVWITRGANRPIFNASLENAFNLGTTYPESISPEGTRWAVGSISDGIENLNFDFFAMTVGNAYGYINTNGNLPLVVHLVKDDVYLELTWIDWHRGNGNDGPAGGFSYSRSTAN